MLRNKPATKRQTPYAGFHLDEGSEVAKLLETKAEEQLPGVGGEGEGGVFIQWV